MQIYTYSANNIPFNSRHLEFDKTKEFPLELKKAIYSNKSIKDFIRSGKPKTRLEKFLDFFKKDRFLNIRYVTFKKSKVDPYSRTDMIFFSYGTKEKKYKFLELKSSQNGIKRPYNDIAKSGEDLIYKSPNEKSIDKLVKLIQSITDFEQQLFKHKK